jgi:LysR family hydrogen peroxide-inducible transcriptional activator
MKDPNGMLTFVPFKDPAPSRRVVIVWRKSFTRKAAIDALCEAIGNIALPGVTPLLHEAAA